MFADFEHPRRPRNGPVEVPIPPRDALEREWVVVADSDDGAACMVGWEPPGQDAIADADRVFETIWTADRATARHAATVCCELAEDAAHDLIAPIQARLAEPVPPSADDLRRAEALTARMVAYLARGRAAAP